jgi:hypothetical protein
MTAGAGPNRAGPFFVISMGRSKSREAGMRTWLGYVLRFILWCLFVVGAIELIGWIKR